MTYDRPYLVVSSQAQYERLSAEYPDVPILLAPEMPVGDDVIGRIARIETSSIYLDEMPDKVRLERSTGAYNYQRHNRIRRRR